MVFFLHVTIGAFEKGKITKFGRLMGDYNGVGHIIIRIRVLEVLLKRVIHGFGDKDVKFRIIS